MGDEEMGSSNRAGVIMRTPNNYSAFIPAKLPPEPPVVIDAEMQSLLSFADRKLGRLDGVTQTLPNPELFVAMYVRKEAVLSSQIEGTQASLEDILNIPDKSAKQTYSDNVKEVVNYVSAMDWGLSQLETLPLSLRLIRGIHSILLKGTRGSEKSPGEFRRSQNWIGPQGSTINTAVFVPPPVDDMVHAMGELESFFYEEDFIPALIKIALIHAQFETIHPFLDGNGRIGRLLITFWLCQQGILTKPLLYLSYYFKQNRQEYYDRLMNVRLNGDWEGWIKFFLRGIASVSEEATESAKQILSLQSHFSSVLYAQEKNNSNAQLLLSKLFEHPYVSKQLTAELLQVSVPTAGVLVDLFCKMNILSDITPNKKRYKTYYFKEYMKILDRGTELIPQP
jgi:Fic family protein